MRPLPCVFFLPHPPYAENSTVASESTAGGRGPWAPTRILPEPHEPGTPCWAHSSG